MMNHFLELFSIFQVADTKDIPISTDDT